MRSVFWMALVGLVGCGGGEDSPGTKGPASGTPVGTPVGSTTTPVDLAPTVAVTWPAHAGRTTAGSVTVKGTASDDVEVTRVTVGGVDAVSDDGFATWAATVELAEGEQTLSVEVEDSAGQTGSAPEVRLTRALEVRTPFGGAWDADAGRLYVVDNDRLELLAVDPDAPVPMLEWVASLEEMTDGVDPRLPLDVDTAGDLLIVPCREDTATRTVGLWALDRSTGTWSVVSDGTTGTGEAFVNPIRLEMDPSGTAVWVLDAGRPGLLKVDLATGDRTVWSDNLVPDAGTPLFDTPADLSVAPDGSKVWIVDTGTDEIFAVHTINGEREFLTDGTTPGPSWGNPFTLVTDAARNRLLYFDGPANRVTVAVDLTTGERTEWTSNNAGPPYTNDIRFLEIDGDRALWADRVYHHVGAFDLTDATREEVLANHFPLGGPRYSADDVTMDADGALVLMGDGDVVRVAADGSRSSVQSAPDGSLSNGLTLTRKGDGDEAWVALDSPTSLYTLDLADGSLELVSGDGVPDGDNPLRATADLAVDPAGDRLWTVDYTDQILEVDTATGARTVLSDPTVPNGTNPPLSPTSLALDAANGRLLMGDWGLDHLLAVDLQTGARTRFSDGTVGAVPYGWVDGVTVDDTGAILAILDDTELAQIDPGTGNRTLVASTEDPSWPHTSGLWRVRVLEGRTYVVAWNGGVLQVDRESGSVVVVSR